MKNKRVSMVATLLALMGPLVACGSGGGDTGKTTITFWHTMGKSIQAILEPMIEDFQKENPNIIVEHSAQGGYTDIKQNLENAIAAGDVPTMAFCYPDHVANYLTSNAVVDVTTYLNDPELAFTESEGKVEDIISAYWQEGKTYDTEGIYSVPMYKSTEVMFYNKDIFKAKGYTVPTTWDEMETLMAQMKADYPDLTPLGYDSDSNLFITMCEQFGVPYTTNENITEAKDHFLFNNEGAKAIVKRIQGWYEKGYFISQGTDPEGSYTSTSFKNGELIMTIGSTGGTTYNYTDNFEIGVAAIPGGTKNSHVIMQGPSICFLRRQTDAQKKAAWKFYKYLIEASNSANFAKGTGYSPVRKSSFETPLWKEFMADPTITGAEDLVRRTVDFNSTMMDSYFVSPTFKGSSTARDEVGGIIANVCTGSKTIDEAFKDAYNNCVFAA